MSLKMTLSGDDVSSICMLKSCNSILFSHCASLSVRSSVRSSRKIAFVVAFSAVGEG